MLEMKITPKFDVKTIVDSTILREWFLFQNEAFQLGSIILAYMQNFISANHKRDGGTGNLAKAMILETKTGAGEVFWGIGNIGKLSAEVPYYYVVNFGKKESGEPFIPGGGKPVFGYFGTGNDPDPSLRGIGTEAFTLDKTKFKMYPGVIRPMNYIEATRAKLELEMRSLLNKLKR